MVMVKKPVLIFMYLSQQLKVCFKEQLITASSTLFLREFDLTMPGKTTE